MISNLIKDRKTKLHKEKVSQRREKVMKNSVAYNTGASAVTALQAPYNDQDDWSSQTLRRMLE